MKGYFSSLLFRIGLAVLLLGSAPLLGIIFLARIGVWPDPDPNPIGPGLLFFVSFWPGVLMMIFGARRARARQNEARWR
jgi:hypothetical protein